jgi:carboxymethylenebutenolidase
LIRELSLIPAQRRKAYGSKLWNFAAPALSSTSHIVGAVVYANASEASNLQKAAIPALYHLAGPTAGKMERTDAVQVYEYPTRDSYSFAVPFQPQFHYSSEAVSHTRNLTFLKKLMNGPYFDLEAIWDEHTYFEFENRSVEHTMATMVAEPYVNHVPTVSPNSNTVNHKSY